MSHFAVLVVTPNGTDEERDALLGPFHEFECTGRNDQYVQDVDRTEEARAQWASECEVYRTADGTIVSPYKLPDNWYRDPTPEEAALIAERNAKPFGDPLPFETRSLNGVYQVKQVPEGVEKIKATYQVREEAEGNTFAQWAVDWYGYEIVPFGEQPDIEGDDAKHKYGYALVDEAGELVKLVDRTNPNRKWDWYVLGGRYSGRIKAKPGVEGVSGRRSWANALQPGEPDPAAAGWVDQARKSDIDFEAMRAENRQNRYDAVSKVYEKIAEEHGLTHEQITALWQQYVGALGVQRTLWEEAKAGNSFYDHLQAVEGFPELQKKVGKIGDNYFGAGVPETDLDPWAWVEKVPSLTTWAFLGTDGVWREKGEMGWFGMSSGDVDPDDWEANVSALIAAVPEDHYLAYIDCHI